MGSYKKPFEWVITYLEVKEGVDRSVGGGMTFQFIFGHMKSYFTKFFA